MKKYAAIILSAGYSSRMGEFKPLINLFGTTAVNRCVNLFESCNIKEVYIITGYKSDEIQKNINNTAKTVYNVDFDKGMFSSIVTGVAALPSDIEAFFVLPVDTPSINKSTIEKLIQSYERFKCSIVYPSFADKKGHPPLISIALKDEIIENCSKDGLRGILNIHKDSSVIVNVADRGVLLDMDTKEDYENLCQHISKYPCPDYKECMEILRLCNTNTDAIEHMKIVAGLARSIAERLVKNGYELNINLLYSGALLHDVAKGMQDHELRGAEIARDYGYPCLYEIIKEHMNIKTELEIGEKEIVYLADKLVKGTQCVTLDERFRSGFEKYKNDYDIIKNIEYKYQTAKKLKEKIEYYAGISIDEIRGN